MSFLYPYTISITRPNGSLTTGPDGATESTTVIVASITASIQLKRDKGYSRPMGFTVGSNTNSPMPMIEVYVPASAGLGQGAILAGDMVTDLATNDQYKVDATWWTWMGWLLACSPYRPNA